LEERKQFYLNIFQALSLGVPENGYSNFVLIDRGAERITPQVMAGCWLQDGLITPIVTSTTDLSDDQAVKAAAKIMGCEPTANMKTWEEKNGLEPIGEAFLETILTESSPDQNFPLPAAFATLSAENEILLYHPHLMPPTQALKLLKQALSELLERRN
jgi:hypothetical protein